MGQGGRRDSERHGRRGRRGQLGAEQKAYHGDVLDGKAEDDGQIMPSVIFTFHHDFYRNSSRTQWDESQQGQRSHIS